MSQVPPPIRTATTLMYLGALAGLIGLFAGIPASETIRENVRRSAPDNAEQVATFAVAGFWITVAVIGLVTTALWVFTARHTRRGQRWARTMASVLFGVYTAFVVAASAGVANMQRGGLSMWISLATWLIGLAAMVLLYRRDTRDFWH